MARQYRANESPVGKTFFIQRERQSESHEVVGVVRNAYTSGLIWESLPS